MFRDEARVLKVRMGSNNAVLKVRMGSNKAG